MSLDKTCMKKFIILHELFHVIGFFHEQSRWDRDDYINIYWDNMIKDNVTRDQFNKVRFTPRELLSVLKAEILCPECRRCIKTKWFCKESFNLISLCARSAFRWKNLGFEVVEFSQCNL